MDLFSNKEEKTISNGEEGRKEEREHYKYRKGEN